MNKVEISRLANLFLKQEAGGNDRGKAHDLNDVALAKEVGDRADYFDASLADAKLVLERVAGDVFATRPSRESAMELFADAFSQLKHKLDDDDLECIAFWVLREVMATQHLRRIAGTSAA